MAYTIGYIVCGWDLGPLEDHPVLSNLLEASESDHEWGRLACANGPDSFYVGTLIGKIDETQTVDLAQLLVELPTKLPLIEDPLIIKEHFLSDLKNVVSNDKDLDDIAKLLSVEAGLHIIWGSS